MASKAVTVVLLWFGVFSPVAQAAENDWQVPPPPQMSAEEIILADAELRPGVVERTKIALASEHSQKMPEEEKEAAPSNELELRTYRGGSGDYLAKLYAEKSLTDEWAFFLSASKARGFEGLTVGPAYYITPEMEIGFSIGASRYASDEEESPRSHRTTSAFWYWKTDAIEAEVTVERYSRDPKPWWYNAYVQTPVTENLSLGVYSEYGVGWGPRLSYTVGKYGSIWLSPIIKRLGDTVAIVGVTIPF